MNTWNLQQVRRAYRDQALLENMARFERRAQIVGPVTVGAALALGFFAAWAVCSILF